MRVFSPALLAACLVVPGAARAQGRCYAGTCADGYTGCGCDADCCRRRLSGGSSAYGGYGAEYATLNMMMGLIRTMTRPRQAAAPVGPSPQELERQRVEALRRQVQAQEEAERQRLEFEERKGRLAADMKGDSPDLSKPPEFKNDEPGPRARSRGGADLCRRLPEDGTPDHRRRLADWARSCGALGASGAVSSASGDAVARAVALHSRIRAIEAKTTRLPRAELDELYEAQDARRQAYRALSDDQKREFIGLVERPPARAGQEAAHPLRLDAEELARLRALPSCPTEEDRGPLSALSEKASGALQSLRAVKGLGAWKKRWEKESTRLLAELAGGGMENEGGYGE